MLIRKSHHAPGELGRVDYRLLYVGRSFVGPMRLRHSPCSQEPMAPSESATLHNHGAGRGCDST